MSSSKQDGTAAAAAEQLGSMSLGESAERKDNGTEPTTKIGTNPTKFCSACGEKSDALKKCNGCKCVWYCDKKCQNKHRKEHRKECKVITKELDQRGGKLDVGTELDLGPIGTLPLQEECPICMHVLPLNDALQTYSLCCGKTICGGCKFQHRIKIINENDKRVQKKKPPVTPTCAFCRTTLPKSDEEKLAHLRNRVKRKDPESLANMARVHGDGELGLPVDEAKCIDLFRQSADLGFPDAYYQLGFFHCHGAMGLDQNDDETLKYWEKAAACGSLSARHNLGCVEETNGDFVAAMRHWRFSASSGARTTINALFGFFALGRLHHSDLTKSLQAFYLARAEMKSEGRDQYIAYLKRTGEYEAEFDDL